MEAWLEVWWRRGVVEAWWRRGSDSRDALQEALARGNVKGHVPVHVDGGQ